MFGSPNLGANAYAKVSMETGVATASPHQLVLMLFEGAMVAITSATQSMQAGDIPAKGKRLTSSTMVCVPASTNKPAVKSPSTCMNYMSTWVIACCLPTSRMIQLC